MHFWKRRSSTFTRAFFSKICRFERVGSFQIFFFPFVLLKVHIFLECHKILQNLPLTYKILTAVQTVKILCPSQNISTLWKNWKECWKEAFKKFSMYRMPHLYVTKYKNNFEDHIVGHIPMFGSLCHRLNSVMVPNNWKFHHNHLYQTTYQLLHDQWKIVPWNTVCILEQ